ncbi:hypothetical protein GXW82_35110 [Streptacidiphilus sp. 4-A2]|nr:hypothetical protein [Streptacidiphilus sp. 4-A2]
MSDTETPAPAPTDEVPGPEPRHRRWSGWFRRMSLRGRLSVLTAAAVVVAIAVCACTCWFVVKDQLNAQAQDSLISANVPKPAAQQLKHRQHQQPAVRQQRRGRGRQAQG